MLKVILFCAILAYLSGVEAQQQPQTWISTNPATTFFRRLNDRTWQEFSTSTGRFASNFTVLDSILNNGVLSVLFLKKDDGNFVVLTRNAAFFSTTGIIGTFFRFANGLWGDANRNPINRMSKSSEQRTPRTILVKEKNGRLTFEEVSYGGKNIDRPSSHHHVSVPVGHAINPAPNDIAPGPVEAWFKDDGVSAFFEKISNELWEERNLDSGETEEFDVLFKKFISDEGVYEILLQKKSDGLFVFISGGVASASFDENLPIEEYPPFATGYWADRDGFRVSLNENDKTTPKRISDELVPETFGAGETEPDERLEVWTNSEDKSNLFIKYMPFLWVEFVDGVPVNTFTLVKVGVTEKMVTLKNNNPDAGDHSFVSLDSNNAYRGMTQMEVKQYATGSFSFLVIPN